MAILRNLRLLNKFVLLGLATLIVAALPTSLYVSKTQGEIDTARREARGVASVVALQTVIRLTQQHRDLAAGVLAMNDGLAAKRPATRDALNAAHQAVDTSLAEGGVSQKIVDLWNEHTTRWTALEKKVADRSLKPRESSEQHTQLVEGLFAISMKLLDECGLSLDPQPDSHALLMAAFVEAPQLAEKMGQLRAHGTGFLAAGLISAEGRNVLAMFHARAGEIWSDMSVNLEKAAAANGDVKTALMVDAEALKGKIAKVLTLTHKELIDNTDSLKLPYDAYFQESTAAIDSVYEFNTQASRELVGLLGDRVKRLRATQMWTLCALALLLLAFMAVSVAFVRHILAELGADPSEAAGIARSVASGDLSVQIPLKPDDRTSLMAQLKNMQQSLAEVVSTVRSNADSVANGTAQISQGNNDLSVRTEQQAAALEKTASSMQELSSTIKQNAVHALEASDLARIASDVALKGGGVVDEVVRTMKGINDSSKKISDIIGVIDSIAFQTNILALNAAVEAARAGDQGRGFAVVASEVRGLASRSAEAAKEIKSLIGASVGRVAEGTALVDKAGVSMQEIVVSIKRVTDVIGEISSASTSQSGGVEQVSQSVSRMDRATQQNAALVEQTTAAAETLKQQAQELVRTVAVFKLG